jgi:hypothetical protein
MGYPIIMSYIGLLLSVNRKEELEYYLPQSVPTCEKIMITRGFIGIILV